MLLAVGPKLVMAIFEDFPEFISEIKVSFSTWYDPFAYVITYLIGYAIVWWKPLWGSLIIILISIFYVIMGGLDGPPIFAIPGFLVGALVLTNWFLERKRHIIAAQ
jgi:hypothetical protein